MNRITLAFPKNPSSVLFLLLVFNFASVLTGQNINDSDPTTDDTVFVLSPFIVQTDRDSGYLSTNSISATALNTQIRDLPMPLETLNAEFMEDIQANNLKEVLRYTAGVFSESFDQGTGTGTANANTSSFSDISPSSSANINDPFVNTISIRGYAVPNQQRLGFRVGAAVPSYGVVLGGLTDAANLERVEIVRGPQALLYGVNVLSGVANLIPRQPNGKFSNFVSFQMASNDSYRGLLDHSGYIVKNKANYRLVGTNTESKAEVDHQKDSQRYFAGQLELLPTPRVRVFLETQYGEYRRRGFGPQNHLFDVANGSNNVNYLRNQFNELYSWSETWPDDFSSGQPTPANQALIINPDRPVGYYDFVDQGRNFRISGPDTYYERNEFNLLGQVYWTIRENLNLEVGVYRTEVDAERFAPNMQTVTNRDGSIIVAFDRPGQTTLGPTRWGFQPESKLGIVEHFKVPSPTDPSAPLSDDYKVIRYWWEKVPTEAETLQWRARLAYTFETGIMKGWGPERHTFMAGIQSIRDDVFFKRRSNNANQYNTTTDFQIVNPPPIFIPGQGLVRPPAEIRISGQGRESEDPLRFRSIFDFSPLRYQGEELATVGVFRRSEMGDHNYNYIGRSGTIDATIKNEGKYLIYHGEYWNNRLNIIAGIRQDKYSQTEREQLIAFDPDRLTNEFQGSALRVIPYFLGDGTEPFSPIPHLPASINEGIQSELEIFRQLRPQGTQSRFPDEGMESNVTKTFGLSWRISDDISVYVSYGEGVFPNTGQRDGNNDLIPSEETSSREVGLKFDFYDGKISGRASVFSMRRSNAVTYFEFAPSPKYFHGHPSGLARDTTTGGVFDPVAAAGGAGVKGSNLPVAYTVWAEPILQAFRDAGRPDITPQDIVKEFGLAFDAVSFNAPPGSPAKTFLRPAFVVPYSVVKDQDNPIRRGMDAIMQMRDIDFIPIRWMGEPDLRNNNPSNYFGGSNVLFDEEANGAEFSLIVTPSPSLQFLLSFAHIERKVVGQGLRFVAAKDENGVSWATPYDKWVYFLGPDAFDDPTDPTSTNGKGINGLSLANIPKDSAAFWGRYAFRDGFLDGLTLGLGAQWYGPAQTSTSIGGDEFIANRYQTPPTPDRVIFDATLIYQFDFLSISWKANFRVNNLFNKKEDVRIARYEDLSNPGEEIIRRTRVFYAPRSFSLTLSADF